MAAKEKSVFEVLNAINVNEHTEVKDTGRAKLTYLSWAWAWAKVKEHYPTAYYTIYENANGWCYHTDGHTAWVKTGVTIENLEHIEYLPVMDYRNQSIPADKVTSFDVNKAIQRSLTKAVARHGLGLYIYAGEDLPEEDKQPTAKATPKPSLSLAEELKIEDNINGCESIDQLTKMFNQLKADYPADMEDGEPLYEATRRRANEIRKSNTNNNLSLF